MIHMRSFPQRISRIRYLHSVLAAWTVCICLVSVGSAVLQAQSRYDIGYDNSPSPGNSIQVAQITLTVKDSTLRYVLRTLSEQSGRQIAFNGNLPQLTRKISINIQNTDVLAAVLTALKGTGLTATVANDAETIIVRPVDGKVDTTTKSTGSGKVEGQVLDSANGAAVGGVTVSVVGSPVSVVTDSRGMFTLTNVKEGEQTLSLRLLGYKPKYISIDLKHDQVFRGSFEIVQSATALGEVVTTATGQQRRVEIPNDIVRIDAEKIKERAPVRTVTDMLEAAQVPGVLVTRASGEPGAPTRIRMRGIGSIAQSNDPVIIVDGMWINGTSNAQGSRGIDDIDPETIETIEIVRGPSASTLYGMDAANGVIVITTKKGRAGTTRWNMGYTFDWGSVYGKKPLRYVGIGSPAYEISTMWCPIDRVLSNECQQDSVVVYDPNHPLVKGEGTEQNHRLNFSVDGGVEAVRYSIAASSQSQLGARREAPVNLIRMRRMGLRPDPDFVRPSFLDNKSITSTLSLSPRDNLDMQFIVAGGQGDLKRNRYTYNFNGLPVLSHPDGNIRNDLNSISTDTINFLHERVPVIMVTPQEDGTVNSNIRFNASSNWRPGNGWVISGTAGYDKRITNVSTYSYGIYCGQRLAACIDTIGNRQEQRNESDNYTLRLNGSTLLNLGKLNRLLELRPSFGGDYRLTQSSNLRARQDNLPAGERNMLTGTSTGVQHATSYNSYNNAAAGWYLSNTIALFKRLYFDIGFRQDIGSAIRSTAGSRGIPLLGGFRGLPKIGQSWLISDEPFFPYSEWMSMLRLRGAIGYAAVQPELTDIRGRYLTGSTYTTGESFIRTMELGGAPNERLVPERSGEIEIGIDTDIIYDRVSLVVTYAHKQNKNAIVTRSLAPSVGEVGGSIKENIARVVNRSLEFSATGRVIDNTSVLMETDWSFTLTDNKVAELGDGIMPFSAGSGEGRIEPGYPIGGIWNRQLLGYRDINSDGLISNGELIQSESLLYLGWVQPRYRASYGLRMVLGGQISFDSRFAYQSQYVQDHRVDGRLGSESISASLADQAIARIASLNGRRAVSDLRWNSASISYHLPNTLLRRLRARSVSVSIQGSNLALWTNYVGRDPSVNAALLDVNSGGEVSFDDGNILPRPRLYSFRLQWGL